MSSIIINIAQFILIIWPLFVVTAFVYSFQSISGRKWPRTLGYRIQKNLLYTWTILFIIWIITLIAGKSVPTIFPEPQNSILFFSGFGVLMMIEINRLRVLPIRIRAHMDIHAIKALNDLTQLDPRSFEELVAETFRMLGYQVNLTGKPGDHGIDIELYTKGGDRWIIQCKRYRNPVGESIIRDLYGSLIAEKAHRAILVTNSEITTQAEAWAKGKPILLVDGRHLLKLIETSKQRAKPSLIDFLSNFFESIIQHFQTPPALRLKTKTVLNPNNHQHQQSIAETRPTKIYNRAMLSEDDILLICPNCGVRMVPHPDHPTRKLYRCRNYPTCKVVLDNISYSKIHQKGFSHTLERINPEE